jgi:hypothetical protein
MARTKARVCGWKIGIRTACPVLIDNLSEEAVDVLWGDISHINWSMRMEGNQVVKPEPSGSHHENLKKRSRTKQAA